MSPVSRLKYLVPTSWRGPLRSLDTQARIATGKLSRAMSPKRIPPNERRMLHLGCGPVDHPGFINVDGFPYPHVHFVRSLDDLSPFADESISLVYASHCLEHFRMSELPGILGEWRRVLKPSGVLRLSVPDFDLILKIYEAEARAVDGIWQPLLGGQDSLYNFHFAIFTESSLTTLLVDGGFSKVQRWSAGTDELTSLPDWSGMPIVIEGRSYPISLNLEAIR